MRFRRPSPEDNTRRSLRGYVTAPYDDLLKCFGMPTNIIPSVTMKTVCEWELIFQDGTYASIYTYYYEPSVPPPDIPDHKPSLWHIGGRSNHAVDRVVEALGTNQFAYLTPGDYEEDTFEEFPF